MDADNTPISVSVTLPGPELSRDAAAELDVARELVIDCQEMYQWAADEAARAVVRKKELTEQRLAITRPLDDAKKRVMDFFRAPIEYLERTENAYKSAMLEYRAEERRKADEAAAAARAAARAEQERLEREAAARDEARRRKEAEAAEAEKAGHELEAEAARAAAQREAAEAAAARQSASMGVAPRTPVAPPPQAAGAHVSTTHIAEVADLRELVRGVHERLVPLSALAPDMKVLNAQARALGMELDYPGVVVKTKETMVTRRR